MQTSKIRKLSAYRMNKYKQKHKHQNAAISIEPNQPITVIIPPLKPHKPEQSNKNKELQKHEELYQQENTPNSIPSNKQQFRFVFITYLLTGIISFWLMQNSVIAYYQQTYHKNSIISTSNQLSWWQKGEQIKTILNDNINRLSQIISTINQRTILEFNNNYAYTPSYKAHKQKQQARQKKQHQQALKLAAKESQIKVDFTLTSNDQVFFAGDSMMQGVAPHVQKWLSDKYNIKTINLSKQSTGLTYNRFFDWNKTIKETLNNNQQIKILIVFLGPNDPWDMPNPEGGSPISFKSSQWENLYRQRIKNIIDAAHQHHVTVLWLTPPNMRRAKLNEQMIYLRELTNNEVKNNHGYVIDTRTILGNDGNLFNDTITAKNGQKVKTRSSDGIHFSIHGQKIIAKEIFDRFNLPEQLTRNEASDVH